MRKGSSTCTGIISGVLAFIGCLIGDIFLVRWLFTLVPSGQWSGLIKVGIVFVDIWMLTGLIFLVAITIGLFIGFVTSLLEK